MKRLLVLSVGPFYYPAQIPVVERFSLLSQEYTGDIFAIVNDRNLRRTQISRFTFTGLFLSARVRHSTLRRGLVFGTWAVAKAVWQHYFRARYDAVLANDPLVSGPIALAIGLLTGARTIIEVNGQYESAFGLDADRVSVKHRLKEQYARRMVLFVLRRASVVRLLYRDQLRNLARTRPLNNCVAFPEFVPVGRFRADGEDGKYILFIGYPWHLKGVDVLIRAFNLIADEFPEYRLKVVGYCPERTTFERLAGGNPRIEFHGPVEYDGVIDLMEHASAFVLPSRTEAMGRVLLEAMACRKPVIGSNVDGIPYVVEDDVTGLLFKCGDPEDLARQLRRLLGSPDVAARIADAGYRRVTAVMAERNYLTAFQRMIDAVI